MVSQYVVLDMFAGAGGLTEGFFRNDFNIVSHIEMNTHAARTLETRALYHALVEKGHQDTYYRYTHIHLLLTSFQIFNPLSL